MKCLETVKHLREVSDLFIYTPNHVIVLDSSTSEPREYTKEEFAKIPGTPFIANVARKLSPYSNSEVFEMVKKEIPQVEYIYVKPY